MLACSAFVENHNGFAIVVFATHEPGLCPYKVEAWADHRELIMARWQARAGIWAAAFTALAMGAGVALAQDDAEEDGEEEVFLAEFVEDFERTDGLFPLYTNPEDGALYMEVSDSQIGQEFIYFLHTVDGTPELFHFRGAYRDNAIFSLHKHLETVEFHKENTYFYHDPENNLSRAAHANITKAVLAVVDITATAEDDSAFLLDVTDLFKSEALHQVSPAGDADSYRNALKLGRLSDTKTKIVDTRNYPDNTDVVVEYVYDRPGASPAASLAVTDARAISITVQHTFVAAPDNDYQPRFDDFRVGYFLDYSEDLTSADFAPYRDVIQRWDLRKQDPDAAVSDPVEPIVFWIENTTPEEFREPIREGALAWNAAFEAAGFSNAIVVRDQPADAEWDAGDIRYNVMRWTSSPNPPFGGYGPSFTNPRTGQILGADIMLEYIFVTNRVKYEEIYGPSAQTAFLPASGPSPAQQALWSRYGARGMHMFCSHGDHMRQNLMAGRAILGAQGASELEMTEFVAEAIKELTLHEIGHTIGLMHNMAASSGIAEGGLASRSVLPANSVMDYNAANIAAPGEEQGLYFMGQPGPYDIWAVQVGYTPDDETAMGLTAQSTEPALIFGNDADDMRFAGINIDPRIMVGDLGPDSLTWARGRIALIDETLGTVLEKFTTQDGDAYQDALISYAILTGQKARAATAVSRWVGGVYQQRSVAGQPGATAPFTPVERAKQEEALALLEDAAFGVEANAHSAELVRYLQLQRRGFASFGFSEDPQVHGRVLAIQMGLLDHLMHPAVLTRLTDSRLYGGEYPAAEYLTDLTAIMFAEDIAGKVGTFRQQLQLAYVNRLVAIINDVPVQSFFGAFGYDPIARSAALAALGQVQSYVRPGFFGHPTNDPETVAHREHILAILASTGVF